MTAPRAPCRRSVERPAAATTGSGLFSFRSCRYSIGMTSRLKWQRNPAGGFVAYPDGEHLPGRRAELRREGHSRAMPWTWLILCDAARASGVAVDHQEASDRANEAWPRVKAEAAVLSARAAGDEALRTLVQRQVNKGDLTLSLFEIQTSPTERLTQIIWLVRDAGGLRGPAMPW